MSHQNQLQISLQDQSIELPDLILLPVLEFLYSEDSEINCNVMIGEEYQTLWIDIQLINTTINRKKIVDFFHENDSIYLFQSNWLLKRLHRKYKAIVEIKQYEYRTIRISLFHEYLGMGDGS
jgi:hypothetical protein